MKWRKYHTHQDGESDCGPACVRTVLRRHGILVDTPILRESIGLGDQGSSLLSLREILKSYGVDTELLRLDADQLLRVVRLSGPVIVLLAEEGYRHFVVIHDIADDGSFWVSDPVLYRVKKVAPDALAGVFHGEVLATEEPTAKLTRRARFGQMRTQHFLWDSLREHRRALSLVLLATVVVSLLALAIGLFVQFAVDQVVGGGSLTALAVLSGSFIALAAAASGLQYTRGRMIITLSQKIQRQLSTRYTTKLLNLPSSFFHSRRTGDLVSRLDDVQEIQRLVTTTTIGAAIDFFVILTVGGYLLVTHSLLFLLLIPPALVNIASSWILYPPIREASEEALQRDATLKSEALNVIQGHSEFVSYGRRGFALERVTKSLVRRIESETRLGRLENVNAVIKLTNQAVSTIVITWVSLVHLQSGSMTVGEVFGYLTLAGYFLNAMESVASLQVTLQRTSAALGRYRDIALQREDPRLSVPPDECQIPGPASDVVARSLVLAHPGPGPAVIDGLDLDVADGRSALVQGRNGSGKSTLLRALAGMHPGYGGSITLGGAEVARMPEEDLRRRILYVPETPVLVSGSLRENLTLGTHHTAAEIVAACRTACFQDIVDRLPDGLDHQVREDGTGFSRGQIQRLSLARAVLRAPKVYLFDESFSGIDDDTFEAVWANLSRTSATKIVVAHGDARGAQFDLRVRLDVLESIQGSLS